MSNSPDQDPGATNKDQSSIVLPNSERVIDSQTILGKNRSVRIRHGEHLYRLMATRTGKLILQK